MCVVVLRQNTVKIKVNTAWVMSIILTESLAIITKFYFQEDVSISFTGKGLWFAIYAIRMRLNKHWKRWRNFPASEKKKSFDQQPEYRQKSPQNSRNMKRLHKVTFCLFGRGLLNLMLFPRMPDLILIETAYQILFKIMDVFNSARIRISLSRA